MTRRTVESTDSLAIGDIKKDLGENTVVTKITWRSGNSISVLIFNRHIKLCYRFKDRDISSRINISSTSVGYGERLWFVCPCCACNTGRLFSSGGRFACRKCQKLTYALSKKSGNRIEYLSLQIMRLQRKLEMENEDMLDMPAYKPKGMHETTFMSLKIRLNILQEEWRQEWMKHLARGY